MGIDMTERPHSFKMHSSMCVALKNLVDKIMNIFPEIEDARPGCTSGIQTLCLLFKALEKAKLLLQYCSESSKLYMAVTGDAILSRGYRAKQSLEQSLTDIQSMVPTVLAMKISQIIQDLSSTVFTLEESEEEAGKAVRELMRRTSSSSFSSDEIKDFHFTALKLHLTTPEAIGIEKRSLILLLEKLGASELNKKRILKYLLCFLKRHEKIIREDHKENSFLHHESINESVCPNAAKAECSDEHTRQATEDDLLMSSSTLPEQFKCPLSLTVMYDPVMISSGYTFERMWIQKWFDEGNDSCPKTHSRLDDFSLNPNIVLKDQITKWCAKNGLVVIDPVKQTETFHHMDFSRSFASFGSSLHNLPDLSSLSITDLSGGFSFDSSSYSKSSKGDFMPMQRIESANGVTDSSNNEWSINTDSSNNEDKEPLWGLTNLPWDEQSKLVEDVRSRFEHNPRAFRFMSARKFLEPLVTYLKNAEDRTSTKDIKTGLNLLLAFLNGNRKAIESLDSDVFKMLSVFLESDTVAEEALNILEILSCNPNGLSKITSSYSLSSLLKIVESPNEYLQEQAMITLKNLSSSNEICMEMVSLQVIQKLTYFLQYNIFSKHSVIILRNLCNIEKGRVSITQTPGCLASISELLESSIPEEQENAVNILLHLCVQKIEYCNLVLQEGIDIHSSLCYIRSNGTEEAKVSAAELQRALEDVDFDNGEESSSIAVAEPVVEANGGNITSEVVKESVVTPTGKRSGLFGFKFTGLKKKR